MKPSQTKLPYLTQKQLDAPVKAVKIKVSGSFTKRGENRKDVYEDRYEAEILVPENWNMGHVKLMVNRHVKNELKGIRARTYDVNKKFKAVPVEETFQARDFMSSQTLIDNDSAKREYKRKIEAAQERQRQIEAGTYAPPQFEDTTFYDADGLPRVVDRSVELPE